MDQTLGKKERLSDKKDIDRLVREGKFRPGEGLRSCVLYDNGLDFSRILVSVPKKMFKRAVKRNLLKRRIREAYRLNKHILKDGGNDILFSYNCKEVLDFKTLEAEVITILSRIAKLSASDK